MKSPRPIALRLVTRGTGAIPRPPFGLKTWNTSADTADAAVLLEAARKNEDPIAVAATQLPFAPALAPGSLVVVLGTAATGSSMLRFLVRATAIPRTERCTALLARGYVDIGAGTDEVTGVDIAWGWSPS